MFYLFWTTRCRNDHLLVKVDHLLVVSTSKSHAEFPPRRDMWRLHPSRGQLNLLGSPVGGCLDHGSLMGPVGAPAQDEHTMENSVTSLLKSIDSTVVSSIIIIILAIVVVVAVVVVRVVVRVVVLVVVLLVVLGGGGGGGSGGGWWCCWQPFFLGALPLLTQGRWILVNIAQDVV